MKYLYIADNHIEHAWPLIVGAIDADKFEQTISRPSGLQRGSVVEQKARLADCWAIVLCWPTSPRKRVIIRQLQDKARALAVAV